MYIHTYIHHLNILAAQNIPCARHGLATASPRPRHGLATASPRPRYGLGTRGTMPPRRLCAAHARLCATKTARNQNCARPKQCVTKTVRKQ